jgi:LCP family protein required for cell wall assembly
MDDIYFSDKKKNARKDNASGTIKNVTDKFVDDDYDDKDVDIKSHTSKSVADKSKNFKVNLPDFDLDVPEPEHITAPSKDIYSSSGARTPQGRRMAPSQNNVGGVPRRPVSPENLRTPQGQRVQNPQRPAVNRQTAQRPQHPVPPQQRKPQGRGVKRSQGGGKLKAVLGIFGVFVVLLLGVFLYGYSALGGLNYDDSISENIYLKDSSLLQDENVRNILFIGSDAREGLDGQRSDSMILFSIDSKNREIKLTSFLRDSYVYIPSKGYNTKLNAAFNYGGAQLLMDTIEYNFGVNIDDYVMVDYDVFIDLVNLLGGITINDVTEKEAKYMQNQVNRPNFKAGTNKNVDGRTAMWYCRIRYVDNDFGRTQRQRKVITAIISKATKTNPFKLVDVVKQVLPNISTNIDRNGLLSLGMGAFAYMRYDIKQQQIPAEGTWWNQRVNGQDVLKLNFEKNKEILKEFIYG